MILKTLTLRNFRKFKNTTIEFPDGVTGVVGLNGAGKSTIFEAIAWVLYGPVAARTPADQIKRQGAEKSEPCRVEIEFIFEEENYRVVREMTGKSFTASATATINGKVAATSAESVTRFIQKKLGMDFKSFYTSIFAKQKELNTLSSMNASERRPLILRMLGIDSLDEIIKEIRADKKNKDALIDKLNSDLTDEKGRDKDLTFKEKIKEINKQKQDLIIEIKNLKEKTQKEKKQLENFEKNYTKNKQEYENLNKKKEEIVEKKLLFEQKKKIEDEISNLEHKVLQREKNIQDEKKKLENYKNVENDLKSTDEKLTEVVKKIEKIVKTVEQKKTLAERIKKDISEIQTKENKIKKIGPKAECPTCERVLADQYDNLLKKFDSEKTNKEKEIKTYLEEVKKNQEEKEVNIRQQNALEKKKKYLQNLNQEKERTNTTIKHFSEEIKNEKKEMENKKTSLKKIGKIVFNEKEFQNIKKQVEKVYDTYQKSLEMVNKQKDKISNLNIDVEKKQGETKLFDQNISNLEEKIKEIQSFKKKIKEEKNTVKYLGMLSDLMSDFRTFLITRIRPTLSTYSSDFFNRLTDGKYQEVELDENYDLLIYDNGGKYKIQRFSGGEEDLANLCLRLAISEVITERAGGVFNFIILDEIFGSQDNIRRQNIMKALNNLSSKFRQIFLITHVEDVKNDMENIIYVTENEDLVSAAQVK